MWTKEFFVFLWHDHLIISKCFSWTGEGNWNSVTIRNQIQSKNLGINIYIYIYVWSGLWNHIIINWYKILYSSLQFWIFDFEQILEFFTLYAIHTSIYYTPPPKKNPHPKKKLTAGFKHLKPSIVKLSSN